MAELSFANQIREKFRKNKFVFRTKFYGSLQSKTDDKYSDIDLEIFTKNPRKFYSTFSETLRSIDDFYVIFPVVIAKNPQVFTIVWKNHPLYRKTDLRIYSQPDAELIKRAKLFNESLRPVYDFYIGATRFIKYRQRRSLVHAMKFYRSAHEALIRLYPNFKKATRYYFLKDEKQIDRYFIEIIRQFLTESFKSRLIKEGTNEHLFARNVIELARNELKRERKKPNTLINYSSRR